MVEVISKKNEAIEFKTLPVESIKNLKVRF
ncbi:unnamed protein product [Gongylonema pulchrum]|uniref:Ubiquitin-like domain-containing protein n=1 Tax=Gongylonema pulchrum TaxID=637853 RepID=A0A183ETT3_9BILA|nr:unnamed protein product [Gongylonema pulchrum]